MQNVHLLHAPSVQLEQTAESSSSCKMLGVTTVQSSPAAAAAAAAAAATVAAATPRFNVINTQAGVGREAANVNSYQSNIKRASCHDSAATQKKGKKCQVCQEDASGNFFGALVCLPCKVGAALYGNALVQSQWMIFPETLHF